jgi:hypothetical protein
LSRKFNEKPEIDCVIESISGFLFALKTDFLKGDLKYRILLAQKTDFLAALRINGVKPSQHSILPMTIFLSLTKTGEIDLSVCGGFFPQILSNHSSSESVFFVNCSELASGANLPLSK